MVSVEYMRNEILGLYKSKRWARRVRQMSDSQVMAIYMKNFGEPPKKKAQAVPPQNDIPF